MAAGGQRSDGSDAGEQSSPTFVQQWHIGGRGRSHGEAQRGARQQGYKGRKEGESSVTGAEERWRREWAL